MLFWLNKLFHWIRMTFQAVQNVRNRWVPELKQLSDNVEKLEASLTGTDECVVDIYELEEKHDDRITTLEEEVSGLKAENVEMRSHFNAMIKQLNDITAFVNEKHGHRIIEETLELDTDTPLLIRRYLHVMDAKGLFIYLGCILRSYSHV